MNTALKKGTTDICQTPIIPEAYSELSKTSTIELFGKFVYSWEVAIFSRSFILTNFSPVSHFYTFLKTSEKGFLTFSGGIEMWHWVKYLKNGLNIWKGFQWASIPNVQNITYLLSTIKTNKRCQLVMFWELSKRRNPNKFYTTWA